MYLCATPRENAHHRKSKLGYPHLIYGLSNTPADLASEGFFAYFAVLNPSVVFDFATRRFSLYGSSMDRRRNVRQSFERLNSANRQEKSMPQLPPNVEILSPARNRVILSVNPKAGRRSSKTKAELLAETLRRGGMEVEILTDLETVARQANELHRAGKLRALIGLGGDGTAAELTNRTEPGVPIALLPCGTANLLAKNLKYSFKPEKFAEMILAGKVAQLDVAQANDRLFLAMIGFGFDAEVVNRVHTARMSNPKGAHINYFSYVKPILKALASYRFPKVRVEFLNDDGEPTGESYERSWAFICNIPNYGWGVPIAPGANAFDGKLNICLWRGRTLWSGIVLSILAQLGGSHRFWWRANMKSGRNFRITPVSNPRDGIAIPYQLDGDPAGELVSSGGKSSVNVRILEKRLSIFVR